jgi:hypothetical protein
MDSMKSASEDSDKLKEDIKEQNYFIKEGFERIKKYYKLPLEKREAETGLSKPPHEILLERSAEIIELGLYSIFDSRKVNEEFQEAAETAWSVFGRRIIGFDYILIGIGTEILLKAIFL